TCANYGNVVDDMEKILGMGSDYEYRSFIFSANVILYRTSWKDRVVTSSNVVDDVLTYTTNYGTEQLHSGVEVDVKLRPAQGLSINGFASIGDWIYKGEALTRETDEDRNIINEETIDFDGGKVGGAAQLSGGLGAAYQINSMFSVDADYRHYDNLYADVGAIKENLELPSYGLLDAGVTFTMPLGIDKSKALKIRANMNNVLDKEYLSELTSANLAGPGDETYKGINVSNQGFFGWG